MTQQTFQAGPNSNTTMPHFSHNMFHGQGPLQFPVRHITQVFLIFCMYHNCTTKTLNNCLTFHDIGVFQGGNKF